MSAALFLFSGLFFLKLLMLYGGLHWIAQLLLASGLALQTTRWLGPRLVRWRPFFRLTLAAMIVQVIALAGLSSYQQLAREAEALAQLPPSRPGAPNVLVITWDTVRADSLSLHGYSRKTTPHLEKWAKKGTWFKNAISPAPWTLPSHASMFTGHYPHELSCTWETPLDAAKPTLAEVLRDQGYLTAGFVANKLYASYEGGLDRGFVHYEDYAFAPSEFVNCSLFGKKFFESDPVRWTLNFYDLYGRKNAGNVNDAFFTWLDQQQQKRPFFAFVNYFDAHDTYQPPPAPLDQKFGPPPTTRENHYLIHWLWDDRIEYPPEILELGERLYDSAIAYQDAQTGRLLEELNRRGLLDNTIVIITADHGEHFGEHGLYLHGQSLYRHLVHVPLVVLYPRQVSANTVVEEFVTLRDLAATVQDLAHPESKTILPGNSWSSLWNVSSKEKQCYNSPVMQTTYFKPAWSLRPDHGRSPVASGSLISLFKGDKYYIKILETGKEEIYDFKQDPKEQHNLAALPEYRELLEEFRAEVQEVFAQHKSYWVDFP